MKILYILGTDGAGKTTLTQKLRAEGLPGRRVRYLYCQHRPFFLWLAKLPARLLFVRGENQFKDYRAYKSRKDATVRRHPLLLRLYVWLWYADVWLQTWPRILWARWTADVVLMDRYYLDWVVNLGVLQGNTATDMLAEAKRLEATLPRASHHVFLDVSEETAFARKADIQSVEYLRERKQRYMQLAEAYGFELVDANQPADVVLQIVRQSARNSTAP